MPTGIGPPPEPKIYHILPVDRLASVVQDGFLWCDATIAANQGAGTTIGMSHIKQRRLMLDIKSHPGLHVGECVPFYFCPRSVMLYVISQRNHPDLAYHGGQDSIVHLECDLRYAVEWAEKSERRWAFTLSNAGSRYFEDRCDLEHLNEIDWNAVAARNWRGCKESKQAEFLVERSFPWGMIQRIGVRSDVIYRQVANLLPPDEHRPQVVVLRDWYY